MEGAQAVGVLAVAGELVGEQGRGERGRDGDADVDRWQAAADPLGEGGHPRIDRGGEVGLGAGEVDPAQTQRVAAG